MVNKFVQVNTGSPPLGFLENMKKEEVEWKREKETLLFYASHNRDAYMHAHIPHSFQQSSTEPSCLKERKKKKIVMCSTDMIHSLCMN